MAIVPAAYASAAEYRAAIGKTDTANDAAILADLTAMSRFVDGKLERFFGRDEAAVARIYRPLATSTDLRVDDLSAAPTSVKVDTNDDGIFDRTLESTDYELTPLNADKQPEAWPFTKIRLVRSGDYAVFRAGQRVEVTARFGWPAVPGLVRNATIQLTAIYRLESPRATSRIQELGEVIEASADAQSLIRQLMDQYRKVTYV